MASCDWGDKAVELDIVAKAGNLSVDSKSGDSNPQVSNVVPNAVSSFRAGTESSNSKTGDRMSLPEEGEREVLSQAESSLLRKLTRTKLIQSKQDIEVLRYDPFSPLHSVNTFEELELKKELLSGLYNVGFNAPSKIQETVLPVLLADPPQNMIAQSQSGTGKTAAFVLAMLSRVKLDVHYPQVLCLSPTFELAVQTAEATLSIGKFMPGLSVRLAVRGEELPRGASLQDQIVIGTPGKVVDWALKLKVFDLSKITVFVLDEADVMIDTQGHQDQSYKIKRRLSSSCQIMFFSATYDDEIMDFAKGIVPNPVVIRLKREDESLENIKQYYIICKSHDQKYEAICNIYGAITIGQAIIFCQTRKSASWLSEMMSRDGHSVALLSGELTVDQRLAILNRFREGREKVLITTNVLSRGIDVEQVTLVINFDLPLDTQRRPDCETYLHRIGRTGRFGKMGIAINFVGSSEVTSVLKPIENHFGRTIGQLDIDDLEELEKLFG